MIHSTRRKFSTKADRLPAQRADWLRRPPAEQQRSAGTAALRLLRVSDVVPPPERQQR